MNRRNKSARMISLVSILAFLAFTETSAKPAPAPASKTLWDSWYTITLDKKIPYAYYNDRVEIRQGRVFFQNQFWKKEEGYINEEQLGAFAEDNENLTPLFFNFHSTYRTTETTIDGTIKDGRTLTAKIRKGGNDLPLIKKNIPSKALLSSLFPVWLGRRLSSLKPGRNHAFMSILEDNLELGFSTLSGRFVIEKPDAYSTKSGTTRLTVNHQDRKSIWYIEASGNIVRIEMLDQNAVVERVPEQVAKKFLE